MPNPLMLDVNETTYQMAVSVAERRGIPVSLYLNEILAGRVALDLAEIISLLDDHALNETLNEICRERPVLRLVRS